MKPSGVEVSRIGYGCFGLAGVYGSANEAESIRLLHHAVDLGINMFDTADAYGPHTNEILVGKALRAFRSQVLIATKFGQRITPDGVRTICGTPAYVREACEASLKRLKIECIDLYYQHRVDKSVAIEETIGAMADMVRQGKVRQLGLSEASAANIRRANVVHPITAVQSEYSLWSRQDEADVLPACRELGISYVAYSPLGRGFLTGTILSDEQLLENDVRRTIPRFAKGSIPDNLKIVEKVQRIAARRGCTNAQICLAWLLGKGVVPIPGTRDIHRLEENWAARELSLNEADIRELDLAAPLGAAKGDRYGSTMMQHIDR